MFNSYMLQSSTVRKIYMTLVIRYTLLLRTDHYSNEWNHLREQIGRIQRMYDSCENGKIVYLWEWHKQAVNIAKGL